LSQSCLQIIPLIKYRQQFYSERKGSPSSREQPHSQKARLVSLQILAHISAGILQLDARQSTADDSYSLEINSETDYGCHGISGTSSLRGPHNSTGQKDCLFSGRLKTSSRPRRTQGATNYSSTEAAKILNRLCALSIQAKCHSCRRLRFASMHTALDLY
jgi:hypothetical protein